MLKIAYHLYKEVRLPNNESPAYDIKQSDAEPPGRLELSEMWSTPLLLSLPGSFWPEMLVPDRVISMGQIELNCILVQNWIAWNRTVWHLNWVQAYF